MRVLTAGMPSHTLIGALERAEWGDVLTGADMRGLRSVLAALVRHLPASAQGKATVADIAGKAGYSHRWTRRCLAVLEELGLIENWERGGVVRGNAEPSWFRVSKRELANLGNLARRRYDELIRERTAATRARIAEWRLHNTRRSRPRPQKPRSVHVALTATPPTPWRDPGPDKAAPSPEKRANYLAEMRQALRTATR